jgi:hypothetical protein
MILDDDDLDKAYTGDKAEGAIGDINTRRIGRDTGLYNTFATLELASGPAKSIDIFSLWYNIKGGRYIKWPCK